ncbi:AbrB/MazE/SpoVT family DNA-binding domain-containing protein [Candidatus Pacearchaeota archaeon]|nr:AbrB/MazE/SpoVT family DNA-binding domain-containing protein [Candidatus Pacearchaeota archaeon]
MEVKTITRKWGNSIAVVIPKEIAEHQNIHEDEEILIIIMKSKPKAGVLFGKFPELKKFSTQRLKDEARKGWESDRDREKWQ